MLNRFACSFSRYQLSRVGVSYSSPLSSLSSSSPLFSRSFHASASRLVVVVVMVVMVVVVVVVVGKKEGEDRFI